MSKVVDAINDSLFQSIKNHITKQTKIISNKSLSSNTDAIFFAKLALN